jgi:hypothetical protein
VAGLLLLAAGATLPACKVEAESLVAVDAESIGIATMKPDGTIVLDLHKPALSILTYPPGHPQYDEIVRHLGGMKPGESKLIPPWSDK